MLWVNRSLGLDIPVTVSIGTPLCSYGVIYRRACELSHSLVFKRLSHSVLFKIYSKDAVRGQTCMLRLIRSIGLGLDTSDTVDLSTGGAGPSRDCIAKGSLDQRWVMPLV